MNVKRLSDCRDFPDRQMDFMFQRMKCEGRCFATRQNIKTINEDTRLGMRKGSFSNQRETRQQRTRGTPSTTTGRWPLAVKRAGVPRNGALTNLTNSHLDSIITLIAFWRMRFYDTQQRTLARMNSRSDDLPLSSISFLVLMSFTPNVSDQSNIRLSWNFADNSVFIRDSSLLARKACFF